jgi:hypothetical protein
LKFARNLTSRIFVLMKSLILLLFTFILALNSTSRAQNSDEDPHLIQMIRDFDSLYHEVSVDSAVLVSKALVPQLQDYLTLHPQSALALL